MGFVDNAIRALGDLGPNQQNLRILDSALGKLVPFVGAGLSMQLGYPSWNTLLEDMATKVGLGPRVRQHIAKLEFEEAAELVVAQASLNYLDDTLKTVFDHNKLTTPVLEGAVRHLPSIARGPVFTTNFDRVVELAFRDAGKTFSEMFHGSRIREASHAIQFDEPFLFKLHGDYKDSEHRILTLTQYTKEYGSSDPSKADLDLPLPTVLGQALSSRPLLFLGCSLRSDRTLTVISRIARRYSGVVHFAVLSGSELTIDRVRELYSWNIRPLFFQSGDFSRINLFLECLAGACEAMGAASRAGPSIELQRRNRTVSRRPHKEREVAIRINGYKLFYFRMTRKLSFSDLSRLSGIDRGLLRRLEVIDNRPMIKGTLRFHQCTPLVLTRLEKAMECYGQLQAGKKDDSLSMYLQFYFTYKGSRPGRPEASRQLKLRFATRVVAFDFDGTLTRPMDMRSTWEKLWIRLRYPIDDCVDLHKRFKLGKLTHETWCELTRDKFRARKLHEEQLMQIARQTQLVSGVKETLDLLKKSGIRLYIVSGSIKQVIKVALGDLYQLFDDVKANEIRFDSTGLIDHIIGTRYDFEGKAQFLSDIIAEQKISPLDVLFVGNSSNDVYASASGARTLCVNPHTTDPDKEKHWTYAIREMTDLRQIMRFIQL